MVERINYDNYEIAQKTTRITDAKLKEYTHPPRRFRAEKKGQIFAGSATYLEIETGVLAKNILECHKGKLSKALLLGWKFTNIDLLV